MEFLPSILIATAHYFAFSRLLFSLPLNTNTVLYIESASSFFAPDYHSSTRFHLFVRQRRIGTAVKRK
jgi:hypothetical protein